jgi:hypothetical protein
MEYYPVIKGNVTGMYTHLEEPQKHYIEWQKPYATEFRPNGSRYVCTYLFMVF